MNVFAKLRHFPEFDIAISALSDLNKDEAALVSSQGKAFGEEFRRWAKSQRAEDLHPALTEVAQAGAQQLKLDQETAKNLENLPRDLQSLLAQETERSKRRERPVQRGKVNRRRGESGGGTRTASEFRQTGRRLRPAPPGRRRSAIGSSRTNSRRSSTNRKCRTAGSSSNVSSPHSPRQSTRDIRPRRPSSRSSPILEPRQTISTSATTPRSKSIKRSRVPRPGGCRVNHSILNVSYVRSS